MALYINEKKYAALLHITEIEPPITLNGLEALWLMQDTGETGSMSKLQHTYFDNLGTPPGYINERWGAYLTTLGYTGSLPEKLYQFWSDYQENFMVVQEATLTTTQLASLHTTGVELVAAAGADKVIVPIKIVASSSALGTAPTGANVTVRWAEGEPASGNLTLTAGSVTFDATEEATEAVAEVEDVALELKASGALTVAGAILTTSIGAAGIDYEVDDEVTIGDATITILTVDTGGEVLTYEITDAGTDNVVGDDQATTGGTGSGFEIDIDSVDVTANPYTLKVKVVYNVFDIS